MSRPVESGYGDAIVDLTGVTFSYPGVDAHHERLDIRVAPAEMLAVVGPNGSGKTTLLRLIAGQLIPQHGSVSVCGVDPGRGDRRDLARRVAVVGHHGELGFPFTALEVVLMGRAPHVQGFRLESPEDLDAAQRAMRATEVAGLAARVFDTLSSGERQRVGLARALAQEPELLLLDEPAAFLDIKQQTRLYDLLTELNHSSGLTVVSVLHDLNIASLYFSRVAIVAAGAIYRVGTPEEVLSYQAIRDVFDTDVYVSLNDLTGKLNVLPLPQSRKS